MRNKTVNTFGNVQVIQRSDYKWGVVDMEGNEIVPFGKYGWIDGFDEHGLARVRTPKLKDEVIKIHGQQGVELSENDIWALHHFSGDVKGAERLKHPLWGIIDMQGNEVLPVEYDNIWNFYGKDRDTTRIERDGEECEFSLETKEILVEDDDDEDYRYTYCGCNDDYDYAADTWDAMTDGMYGDMPEGFDGDYSFMGHY